MRGTRNYCAPILHSAGSRKRPKGKLVITSELWLARDLLCVRPGRIMNSTLPRRGQQQIPPRADALVVMTIF